MKMKNIQTKTMGLFPLSMVILPKESVRLHIFESQFKALVNDCFASGNDFVIPYVFDGKPTSYGTCVRLVDVERFYPDGKMDIKVEGLCVVRIANISSNKSKPYSVGEIETIESAIPEMYSEELNRLFKEYCCYSNVDFDTETNYSVFEMARFLKLNKETKIKLLRYSNNSIVQTKIILNELRLEVLTHNLQDQAGFRYYMN